MNDTEKPKSLFQRPRVQQSVQPVTSAPQTKQYSSSQQRANDDETTSHDIAYLNPESCPRIPDNIGIDDFEHYFFVKHLSHLYSIEASFDTLTIILTNGEEGLNRVAVPYRLFAPNIHDVRFPNFIFNISKFSHSKIDYIPNGQVFNQNELLYLIIHHRLQMYAEYKNSYTFLLQQDIQNLMDYADYNMYSSANAHQKSLNSYVVIDPYDRIGDNEDTIYANTDLDTPYRIKTPIGENVVPAKLDAKMLDLLFRDLNILPSSESMASDTSKFVISDKEIYRAAGFKHDPIRGIIKTIFGIKPNIPARFKSHVSNDAFRQNNFDYPIFTEDLFSNLNSGTDMTLLNAICVFEPIEDNGRLLCGEIEASERFAENTVIKREIVKSSFSFLSVKSGEEVTKIQGRYILGKDENSEEVSIRGFDSVRIISIENIGLGRGYEGYGGNYKIVAECVKRIGSSNIRSSTGIKGVTKPKKDLGDIVVKNFQGTSTVIPVDLIVGSNSIKGKENTIFLAQAALAHQLGFCESKTISSMDETLINNLANKIGYVNYVTKAGTRKVLAGIVPVKVVELSEMYKSAKMQSFMVQSAWQLYYNGHRELAEHIYQTGVSVTDKSIVEELAKIIWDDRGVYINEKIYDVNGNVIGEEKLPVYDIYEVKDHFTIQDCKIDPNPSDIHISKLLTPENKGFYLYAPHKKEYFRMPSNALIQRFVTRIADGTYIYPRLLTVASQILLTCLVPNPKTGRIDVGYLIKTKFNRFDKAIGFFNKLTKLCIGILHKNNNVLKTLTNPKLFGCSMKQMVDIHVPKGVAVIMDRNIYEKLGQQTDGYMERYAYFHALLIRNPVIWKSQIQAFQIWDFDMFKSYIQTWTNVNIDEYFYEKYCRDLVLINPDDAILQQSDVDGDLLPVFVVKGYKGQELLKKMIKINDRLDNIEDINIHPQKSINGVDNICFEELKWIAAYKKSEAEGNDIFIDFGNKQYKINEISLRENLPSKKSFSHYFANSIIAKGDIGIGTNNMWQLQILLDIYKLKADAGEIVDTNGKKASLSTEEYNLMSYAYSRLLQDMVVRGIKWNESGSSEFKPFLLANITEKQYKKNTFRVFTEVIGLSIPVVTKLFDVLNWGISNEYIGASKSRHLPPAMIPGFIRFYNSGSRESYVPTSEFEKCLFATFYGSILKDFFAIRNNMNEARKNSYMYAIQTVTVPNKVNADGTIDTSPTRRFNLSRR